MEEQLDFILEEKSRRGGVSVAIIVSIIVHTLLITYIILNYHPVARDDQPATAVHFVELIRQNPRQFTEAPGPKTSTAPLTAPLSDANRHASTPRPTGETPTTRPGIGGLYRPPSSPGAEKPAHAEQAAAAESELTQPSKAAATSSEQSSNSGTFAYHPSSRANPSAGIDWRSAIREVGKVASLGTGQQGMDLPAGGEKGFAESGPLSFESQWYDWGEYAQSMVNRIRVNWYNNMPQLIQTGLKGVVTIRFTIHRDGELTDVTILSSSGIPPYDFAAKKAIELSSPLNPLPRDFPNATERVTCMFFYNQEPPSR